MTPVILRDPQLGLFEAKATDASVIWLEGFLKNNARWMKAADILRWHGRTEDDMQKRLLRELAAASEWIISGQMGYKHIEHASPEENAHASNWLISQGKKTIKRGIAIRVNACKRLG
ncbi:MAG: hypothetical protein WDM80_19025 [Limisphaerales bacterium]